ncbi:unnamed protein product [Paramecium primaurelia]|uniref:EF-hand domain-containing protein n=1 Tax=Paramecium primaurelia TaxID=5886 RepID=A0A8S1ND33_PARPR|nr:unnamed protein product [Paramecium primaurelia]
MKGLEYPYFVYKPVLNQFITDDEINELLQKLNIKKYATLERLQYSLFIQFEFDGDKFISLSDLINYTRQNKNNDFIHQDYAIIIINSILTEFQNNYCKYTQDVNFDLNEIWIGNEFKSEKQVEVIFTQFNFKQQQEQKQNTNPNIQLLQETIQELLTLCQTNSQKPMEIQEQLLKCNNINDIQNIIKKNLAHCQKLQIQQNKAYVQQHVDNILNQTNEIQESMNQQNYRVLRGNLINWIIKSNTRFNDNVTIKDIFLKLNLEASYKLFTQWSDVNQIFSILKENQILNQLQSLQVINNFIFSLAFPTYHLKNELQSSQFYQQNTIQWIEQVENLIVTWIERYIANILSFYKGDKEDWIKLDFKCIFNQVRQSFDLMLSEYNNVDIIKQSELVEETTLKIIEQYYKKKVEVLNQEILRLIIKTNLN